MLFYILFLILIPIILSYIILKFIYRKIFKSQKKVSKILVFLGSVGLIVFYYTPYSYYLEPSFWEFRNICKLNELPNDEYKFNKILGYFNQNFESLDWDKLNREAQRAYDSHIVIDYRAKTTNYSSHIPTNKGKLSYNHIFLYPNSKERFSKQNLPIIVVLATWHTNRFYLDGNEGSGVYWNKNILTCVDTGIKITIH